MITDGQFNKLAESITSSWAIWSEDFLKPDCRQCVENEKGELEKYFKKHLKLLKNNIILLGLNPSGKEGIQCHPLGNFHTVLFDYGKRGMRRHPGDLFLSKNIMELDNIKGAYMTDASDVIESDSSKVSPDENDVKNELEAKLKILGSKNVHIVCFGNKVFNIINKKYGKKENNVEEHGVKKISTEWNNIHITFYKVYHYSYIANGYGADKEDEFKKQLEYVDKEAGKTK